jgi:16S rRNA (cytidine1402-2'-O)-methyltransferase
MPGTLFVVATPIGNLEDLTFRALRTLREVHLIAAEDTRRTSKLLAHYEIQKPLVSLHQHNEHHEAPKLVLRLAGGEDIALVSDAGTPGISDPGQHLVSLAREAGIHIVPVPGVSAITAALSVSGLTGTRFTFLGFPPSSGKSRREWLDSLRDEPGTIVFFESPHRIGRTLSELKETVGERPIIVNREITKKFEELVVLTNSWHDESASSGIGEFVVIVGPIIAESPADVDGHSAGLMIGLITETLSISDEAGLRAVAAIIETSVQKLRKAIKKARILEKRSTEARP